MQTSLQKLLETIIVQDPRYPLEAYQFVYAAVNFAKKELSAQKGAKFGREINSTLLLKKIRAILLDLYGCMAINVLNAWNIYSTEDFGNLIHNLAKAKLLSFGKDESKEDFKHKFDFHKVFVLPFKGKKNTEKMPQIWP